ncbi:MAG TPA: hypothetical protein DIV46_04535 [Verrucomicrobiales bacterium]|nr:hypothetical protein [Verrucomicrobiales bacterium]
MAQILLLSPLLLGLLQSKSFKKAPNLIKILIDSSDLIADLEREISSSTKEVLAPGNSNRQLRNDLQRITQPPSQQVD